MKRVAFVFDKMIYGGIERIGLTYISELLERGYSIDVFILDVDNVEDIIKELPDGVTVRLFGLKRRCAPAFALRLAIKVKSVQYLLPVIKIGLYISLMFKRIMFGGRISYDCAIAFSGHLNDLTFVASRFVDASVRVAWLHGAQYGYYLMSPSYYELYCRFTNLVCLSNTLDDECEKAGYLQKPFELTKIYNPIIKPFVDNDNVKVLVKKWNKYVLVLGRIAHDKDPLTVIRCVAVLRDKYQMTVPFLFVGDGDMRSASEVLVAELGLGDLVVFEGRKANVGDYYSAASCFVHSSPSEGMPTTILEAMTFGVPVVATDSMPGVREIDGGTDSLDICRVGDAEQMAEMVYKCLNDEDHRNKRIFNANERIKAFDRDKAIDQIEAIINASS